MSLELLNLTGRRRLPVILQAEMSECGLACIAMVAGFHGNSTGLQGLRQQFGPGGRGATLNHLMAICSQLALNSRAVRCEAHELGNLVSPAILHWDFTHYVVLKKASRRSLTVHDPAVGLRTYPVAEAANHFTGVALEVTPAEGFEQVPAAPRQQLWDFFGGASNLVPVFLQIVLISALLQLVALATPFYMQLVVDEVLVKQDADLLALLATGFLGLTLFGALSQWVRGLAGIYLTSQLSFLMGAGLFRHLLSLPVSYFMKRQMGDLVSRFGSIRPVQDFVTNSTITVLLDGVMAVTTVVMMFLYSPRLAAIVLAFMALYLGLRLAVYRPLRQRQHESIVSEAQVDSSFMETIRSVSAIKRFHVEPQKLGEWQNRAAEAINNSVRFSRLGLVTEMAENLLAGVANVLVIFVGAQLVLGGQLSIGMLYAFIAYRTHTVRAMTSLVDAYLQYLMLSIHLERLADMTETAPEESDGQRVPVPIEGGLGIKDGSFRYSDQEPHIFRHLNLQIEPGEIIGIYGPSGCGKSTLLAVLQQLEQLDAGEVTLDEYPCREAGIVSLRHYSASVLQGDGLLSGSIESNISFGDAWPDPARLQRAAALACIDADIKRLPLGYQSQVGEMGTALSAGQVQRILIARALYREPRILFLDEGTAHLDPTTEMKVMGNLAALGITCIFVTHSKQVLQLADRVLWWHKDGFVARRKKPRLAVQ
ncbi:MAG: peptidase domain-containing ABC transporter [Pseudomonadota bacterium]